MQPKPSEKKLSRGFATRQSYILSLLALLALFASSLTPMFTGAVTAAQPQPHVNSYTVTDTSDNIADTGSLRYAISQANANNGGNISFASSLTSGGAAVITLSSVLSVTSPITITGPGASLLTISGNNATQIFAVDNGGTCTTATCQLNLSNLTLANGKATNGADGSGYVGNSGVSGSAGNNGGAVTNVNGSLSLNNVVLNSNFAGNGGNGHIGTDNGGTSGGNGGNGGNGGAVYNSGGTITISNSTLISNSAGTGGVGGSGCNGGFGGNGGDGGAIYSTNSGTITITSSTFYSNTGGTGGFGSSPNPVLGGCATHQGTAGNGGNGGAINNASGTVTVINSTLTENSAGAENGGFAGNGGAIYDGDSAIITNSTIVSNSVGMGGAGGGIYVSGGTTLANSIVAGNTGGDAFEQGGGGPAISNGYNVIGDGSGFSATTGDDFGTTANPVDPKVVPLANNGGPTLTMALQAGSPAIERVATGCLATDQRGVARTTNNCDSGAYELTVVPVSTTTTLVSSANPSNFGDSVTFTATVTPLTATGTVVFTVDNSTVYTATLDGSTGVATYVTNTLSVGTHPVVATYTGSSGYISSTSNTVNQQVNAVVTTTTPTATTTTTPTPTTTTPTPTTTTPTPTTPPGNITYNYFLPFLANNAVFTSNLSPKADSYNTYVSVDNTGSSPANFTITYYDATGKLVGTDNNGGNALAPNNRYQPANGFTSGQNGSALVSSNQPLDIVVSEAGTVNGIATASSYTAVQVTTDALSTIYAPIALNNSYGGYFTKFIVDNLGGITTTATIQYYKDNGQSAGSQSVVLAPYAQANVPQGTGAANLPSGFSGWAIITSTGNQPISGQVVETNANFSFLETINMTGYPGKTLFIPTVFQNAFGNFNTGMQLVNPNATIAHVTVTYYRKDGTKITAGNGHGSFTIGPNSDISFYHSAANFPELNTPNGGFVGTAIVTSDQYLVSVVNQAGSLSGVQYNGAFGTVLGGSSKVSVPIVVKNSYGYTTGLQVSNVSSIASTATLTYYDTKGNKVYAYTLKSDAGGAIPAYGSVNPYLGIENNLPANFDGIAVVSADTNGAQFVVIANNASSQFFYTFANNS